MQQDVYGNGTRSVLAAAALGALMACDEPDFDAYLSAPGGAAEARVTTPWPAVSGPGAAKFSALTQLTPRNVERLSLAWTFRTGDPGRVLQVTPILVDGRLVLCTPHNQVVALDPATGAELWRFDARIPSHDYGNVANCRGVSQWQDPSLASCPSRIFMATNDARLLALDAASGEPCGAFGTDGEVDLKSGVGELRFPGEYQVVVPPAVVGDVVVTGASIADNQRTDAPSGVVRGYSARSGRLLWAFDLAPPGYDYQRLPVSDAGYALGTPNVWTAMVADEARDIVYLPTGNPAPDYARAAEPAMAHYGSAVVALRGATGEYLWHFNTVLNDLWDFDVPSTPSLVDLTLDGKTVPALIQSTKMGFVFVLNRETGEPLMDVTLEPVPQRGPLAARLSPVQPFPPDAFRVSRSYEPGGSVFGLCDELEAGSVIGPVYTPITEQWTVGLPSNMGATNWGGVAVDAGRGLVVVNTNSVPFRTRLIAKSDARDLLDRIDDPGLDADGYAEVLRSFYERFELPEGTEVARQRGTDFIMARHVMLDPFVSLPCAGFPLAELMVLDLHSQSQLWRRPHGTLQDAAGLPVRVGASGMGGSLVTATGLIFIGAASERAFRAYSLEDGELLWQHRLPFPGNANPMTYEVVAADGSRRQFVVIAAGGDARAGVGGTGDYIVAFTLP